VKITLLPTFFHRPVLKVAPELLGKVLARKLPNGATARMQITEVEAYDGERDLACHARYGRTQRTEVMYASGGIWYVYLVYGMHHMLNIVTGPKDYPAAVLIRGVAHISGPGRVTKELFIDKTFNGKAAHKQTGLWLEDSGAITPAKEIVRTPRIGVSYAKEWAEKPYRFVWNAPTASAGAGMSKTGEKYGIL